MPASQRPPSAEIKPGVFKNSMKESQYRTTRSRKWIVQRELWPLQADGSEPREFDKQLQLAWQNEVQQSARAESGSESGVSEARIPSPMEID